MEEVISLGEEGLVFIPLPQSARWGSHPEPPVLPPALEVVPLSGKCFTQNGRRLF